MWCLKQEAGETTEEALFHRHNEGNTTMGVMPRACLHYIEQCMQDESKLTLKDPPLKRRGMGDITYIHTRGEKEHKMLSGEILLMETFSACLLTISKERTVALL